MSLADEYQMLRAELDAAYTAADWDSERIDRIADRLVPIEKALAQHVESDDRGFAVAER